MSLSSACPAVRATLVMGPMDVAMATARAAVATIGEIPDDMPLGAAVAAVVTAAVMAGVQEVFVLPHLAR